PNLGGLDVYVRKFDPTGTALLYTARIGGTSEDRANAISVLADGTVFVTGFTKSSNFHVTGDAIQPTRGGATDAFLVRLSPGGATLDHSTFFGGSGDDFGFAVDADHLGAVVLAGMTASNNFPVSPGGASQHPGGTAGFVSHIKFPDLAASQAASILPVTTDFRRNKSEGEFINTSFVGDNGFALLNTILLVQDGTGTHALVAGVNINGRPPRVGGSFGVASQPNSGIVGLVDGNAQWQQLGFFPNLNLGHLKPLPSGGFSVSGENSPQSGLEVVRFPEFPFGGGGVDKRTNSETPNSLSKGDPVSLATGELHSPSLLVPDLDQRGPFPLSIVRFYGSFLGANGVRSA
ncbi:MAG: hypothetical protein GY953_32060, partial [bacterium]|nr:hypothetical protein [bacterium]